MVSSTDIVQVARTHRPHWRSSARRPATWHWPPSLGWRPRSGVKVP